MSTQSQTILSKQLRVALKEWDAVCQVLQTGRQIVLLRKGGIEEAIGGFTLEHPQFLLFPTFVHQNREMLKAEYRGSVQLISAEPQTITLAAAGSVTDIIRLKSRRQIDAIDEEHVWTSPLIDMRFNYRPMNPLYLLLVRVYKLPDPVTIQNTPAYAGCKSWVPLENAISTGNALPVLDDPAYQAKRESVLNRIQAGDF